MWDKRVVVVEVVALGDFVQGKDKKVVYTEVGVILVVIAASNVVVEHTQDIQHIKLACLADFVAPNYTQHRLAVAGYDY